MFIQVHLKPEFYSEGSCFLFHPKLSQLLDRHMGDSLATYGKSTFKKIDYLFFLSLLLQLVSDNFSESLIQVRKTVAVSCQLTPYFFLLSVFESME